MKPLFATAFAALAVLIGSGAVAEPVSVEVELAPKEQLEFQFADQSGHFIRALRREGKAEGSGIFAGADVVEFGWHDVHPPFSGDPQGYLQITAPNGDVAVLHWVVKAVFTKGEARPALVNHGFWQLVRGTGQFEGKSGVGSLILRPEDKKFILEGEVGDKP